MIVDRGIINNWASILVPLYFQALTPAGNILNTIGIRPWLGPVT